ncbi:MAG: glucodextranase DOMON-like domain-containing protein [Anaerolineae bacterium]|nr:glucodextranase DOMON-like domain-containing protein [Anaerolineae bacterium]
MLRKPFSLLSILVLVSIILAACGAPTASPTPPPQPTEAIPTPTATPAEEVLYLNLMWHQHQPLYYKDENGIYTRPWVRVHATKDYYDMAAIIAQYPNVHVTFNLTPVLLRQLDDFVQNGAKDRYWVLSEKPASELTQEEKEFILRRFFDANWDRVIPRYPGYLALFQKRGGTSDEAIARALETFTEQDFRDLQVWFNLAWMDPDDLAKEPLRSLVAKDRGFTEEDKVVLFNEVRRVMAQVIPIHRELQEKGQIEVTTTPYAHPILPLIYNTNLAQVGNPDALMPLPFAYPEDAAAHLQRSVEIYEAHFGRKPRGLWPAEGAVAQEIVPLVAQAGYVWMATGEPVLAQSLGIGDFTRDARETVQEADALYRPYYVEVDGHRVAVFFRDWNLSDKIGFTYSGMPGKEAAQDLMNRLENIRQRLKEEGAPGPHIVSIILDGENAWEYYENDGKEFLHTLYQLLSESRTIRTVTPSEYLAMFPQQRTLERLFPGAWFSANYDTWIGEPEERQAWNYLARTRYKLAEYIRTLGPESEKVVRALDYMYLAEGSDWFWWYGTDQDSGQDEYFDEGFRALLKKVYEALGEPVPAYLHAPIIPRRAVQPDRDLQGLASPRVDGQVRPQEWASAALYGGPQVGADLALVYDARNLYVLVTFQKPLPTGTRVGLYFASPRATETWPLARALEGETPTPIGIAATHLFEWDGQVLTAYEVSRSQWRSAGPVGEAAMGPDVFEAAIPWDALGELEPGDDLRLVVLVSPTGLSLPVGGPAQVVLPDLGRYATILTVEDPEGDDHGPGTYTYPTDDVFKPQVFDLKSFTVAYDEKNLVFKFVFYGPVPNPWGSPNNLALQTLDVYVDKDPGAGTGARLLLPGRNAALEAGNGWDVAVWAEGWTPQILAPDPQSGAPKQVTGVSFKVIVDPAARTVTLRVPRSAFGEGDPAAWGYAAAVLSQEGYPSSGVWRVRDVLPQAQQWRFGGGPDDVNHTRIIDLAWAGAPTQEDILSRYPASKADIATLGPDDFPQIPLLRAR